jgi:alkylhydroperoxidase family enzyme
MATYLSPIGKADRISVLFARMPGTFHRFYARVSRLDRKLELPRETAILVRERVAGINHCPRSAGVATREAPETLARLSDLNRYASSPLFTAAERAALDFATELAWGKRVEPETFELVGRHYSERQICDLVWLVASEHLYNMTTIGLDVGTSGLLELPSDREPAAAA